MKKVITILFLVPLSIYSQTALYIQEYNDTKGMISNQGYLFHDKSSVIGYYQVPKTLSSVDEVLSIYITTILSMGKVDDVLKGVGPGYPNFEFGAGPIANDYNLGTYVSTYDRIWSVYRTEVLNHILNWDQLGYVVPLSISSWPGNGNILNGEAQILAPFEDVNGNSIYEPELGEYPLIRGDQATFCILNDENNSHLSSGLSPLKQEIHLMTYQYATDDCLSQTTFLHFEIFNRSPEVYTDYTFGLLNDYDLGNFADDFVGSDSNLSLSYVYNGDSNDENNGGTNGYGVNPPAFGFMELNQNLSSNVPFDAMDANTGSFNNMKGLKGDGTAVLDALSAPTSFSFDNSIDVNNTEKELGNIPSDKRMVLGTTSSTLNSGESICRDFAMIYARADSYITGLESVDSLKLVASFTQNFYDSMNFSCTPMVGIKELSKSNSLTVFPNPADKLLTISLEGEFEFSILSLDGKLIQKGKIVNSEINVESLNSGVYYLEIISDKGVSTTKFSKK